MTGYNFKKYCLEILYEKVPEINNLEEPLKSDLEFHLEDDEPLVYCIYEDVVAIYFMQLIKKKDRKSLDIVRRIAELIEEFVEHENFDVRCLVKVGFLESLLSRIEPRKDVEKYLLPKTLEMARAVGKHMYGFDPQTWEVMKKNSRKK